MPAATTHVEFAKDVSRFLQKNGVSIPNKKMFWLGSQGPDILFFSRISILPGSLHRYGNRMHDEKIYEVIHFFEEYAKDDADLTSYIQGYLCHYALDSTAHPLVYARTSYLCEKYGVHEGLTHVSLEAELDIWVLQQRGKTKEDYNVFTYLQIDSVNRKKLAKMYHAMFKEVFNLDIAIYRIDQAIAEIYIWTKVIQPRKKTYDVIYAAENVLHSHFVTAMMLYGKKVGEIVNLDHRSYPLPWNRDESISASFPELYGKAVFKAVRLIHSHDISDFNLDFNGKKITEQ